MACFGPVATASSALVYVCLRVDYTLERACFVTELVIALADNCSREYNHQLYLVHNSSARNSGRLICRLVNSASVLFS